MSFVKSFQLMEGSCKEKKTTEPSHHLFQIKLSNETAGRREVLTVFPKFYKVLEQTSIPLGKNLHVQGGTHSATLIYLLCISVSPVSQISLTSLSSSYKATLAQLKTIVSSLCLWSFGLDLHTITKLLIFFLSTLFLTLFLFFIYTFI